MVTGRRQGTSQEAEVCRSESGDETLRGDWLRPPIVSSEEKFFVQLVCYCRHVDWGGVYEMDII